MASGARRARSLAALLLLMAWPAALLAPAASAAEPSQAGLCFLQRLPAPLRLGLADDAKLLIGWVFDAASSKKTLQAGDIVDARSGFTSVPGFAGPTPLDKLKGRYRVLQPPFDRGNGYYGLAVAALDSGDEVAAILLVNRLFRMPVALQDPGGLATDILTNGGMALGFTTAALGDAEDAAVAAQAEAASRGAPLVAAGQSQAGGVAQLQAAYLQRRGSPVPVGFMTMNAAYTLLLVNRLGLAGREVAGVNFAKDRDPGVGPHALFANRIGLQVYIHSDGSAGLEPGGSISSAMLHPRQHFLDSFTDVSLAAALARVLAEAPPCR